MFNKNEKLQILAIGAHGDDIELACGGTLAKAVKQGHEVTMVIVTGTGFKDKNGKVIRTSEIADQEIKDAAQYAIDSPFPEEKELFTNVYL